MPPAHMIFFALLIMDRIQAQYSFLGDSEIISALEVHWIFFSGVLLCVLGQTALFLAQFIFGLVNVCDFLGTRCIGRCVLCILSIWGLIWSISSGSADYKASASPLDGVGWLMRAV